MVFQKIFIPLGWRVFFFLFFNLNPLIHLPYPSGNSTFASFPFTILAFETYSLMVFPIAPLGVGVWIFLWNHTFH